MADLRIFSYLPNPRLYKATIAARFSGAEIEIVGSPPRELMNQLWDFEPRELSQQDKSDLTEYARPAAVGFKGGMLYKTDAFLLAHPFGNVPAGFSGDGSIGIFESNSIMRAAARIGPNGAPLLGDGPMGQSRVDAFLDRSLVFARDMQRYLLSGEKLNAELHQDTQESYRSYVTGLDRALSNSEFVAGPRLTLADIVVTCELCLVTNEARYAETFDRLGVGPISAELSKHTHLMRHLRTLSTDDRFSADLSSYFEKLFSA